MTDLRTAAQQALEAMEYHVEQTRPIWKTSEAITALRAALAEKALHIDTLRMALEAGFGCDTDGHIFTDNHDGVCDGYLERFASLVAAAEREACAKVCEDLDLVYPGQGAIRSAAAIRARGQA